MIDPNSLIVIKDMQNNMLFAFVVLMALVIGCFALVAGVAIDKASKK